MLNTGYSIIAENIKIQNCDKVDITTNFYINMEFQKCITDIKMFQ